MARYNARTDQVTARIDMIVERLAFTVEDFQVPSTFYKTASGKKLHATTQCTHTRNANNLKRVDGVIGVDKLDRCDCSLVTATGRLEQHLNIAEIIGALEAEILAISNNMSLVNVRRTTRALDAANDLYGTDWCATRYQAAIDTATALLASPGALGCKSDAPRRAMRHALLQVLFGVAPESTKQNYSSSTTTYPAQGELADLLREHESYGDHCGLPEAWLAFSTEVFADHSTATAVGAAFAAAVKHIPREPLEFRQSKAIALSDLDITGHSTIGEAVRAAWRHNAVVECERIVNGWGRDLDAGLEAALASDSYTLLAFTYSSSTQSNETSMRPLRLRVQDTLSAFEPREAAGLVVVCVPDVIADWVTLRNTRNSNHSWGPTVLDKVTAYSPVTAGFADATVSVAVRLLEDGEARKTEQLLCSAALTASI